MTIKEQFAFNDIDIVKKVLLENGFDLAHDVLHQAENVLKESIEEPRWIPVTERLPEKNMPCLLTVGKFHLIQIGTYSDLMGTINHKIFWRGEYGKNSFENITEYVIAWMPLPKPYEEGAEE